MQEPTAEELQAAVKVFEHYLKMPKEEKAAAMDSGAFNSYLEAYLIITLYSMNAPKEQIRLATGVLKSILDDTPADAAADLAKDILQKRF